MEREVAAVQPSPGDMEQADPPLSPSAAKWVRQVRVACQNQDTTAVLALLHAVPRNVDQEAGAMRAVITRLGRLDLRWQQLRFWLQLLKIRGPADDVGLERLLRLSAETVATEEGGGPTDPVKRMGLFQPLMEASLTDVELTPAGCAALVKLCAYCDGNAAGECAARVLDKALSILKDEQLSGIAASSQPFREGWLIPVYSAALRRGNLTTAEWAAARFVQQSPSSRGGQRRYLDVLLRQGNGRAALKRLNSGAADFCSSDHLVRIYKRLTALKLQASAIAAACTTRTLVRLFMAFALRDGRNIVLRKLATEIVKRPNNLLWRECGMLVGQGDPSNISALRALAEHLLTLDSSGYQLAEMIIALLSNQWQNVKRLAAQQGASRKDLTGLRLSLAFGNYVSWRDIVSDKETLGIMPEGCRHALVSIRAPGHSQRPVAGCALHLRWGRASAAERELGVVELKDVLVNHNTDVDFRSAVTSATISEWAVPYLSEPPTSDYQSQYLKEVFSLCFEDRIFFEVKAKISVAEKLKAMAIGDVVIVCPAGWLLQSLELAYYFEMVGIRSYWTIDGDVPEGWDDLVDALDEAEGRWDLGLLYLAKRQLGSGASFPLGFPEVRNSDAEKKGTLVVCSLSDPSYFTASVSICRTLRTRGEVVVYNGGTSGSDIFLSRLGIRVRQFGADADERAGVAVEAALRHLFSAVIQQGTADESAHWLVSNASRVLTAVRTGLVRDIAHASCIHSLLQEGQFRQVVTVPGRMTCARSATLLARASGATTLDVQAFFVSPHPRYRASLADIYCGISEDQIDIYRAKQPSPSQIIARVGSLVIDESINSLGVRSVLSKRNRRGRHSVSDEGQAPSTVGGAGRAHRVIYCAQHGEGEEGEVAVRLMIEAARALPGIHLTIKLHPRTPIAEIDLVKSQVTADLENVDVVRDGSIYQMILDADLVVTRFSNVGLEAAVLGLPVISINTTGTDFVVDLPRLGLADRVTNEAEAISTVRALLFDPEFLEAHQLRQDAYFGRNPELRTGGTARIVSDLLEDWSTKRH